MSHDDRHPMSEGGGVATDREPSVGERLRAARDAQPLSLAQISAELRIEPKFLEALEDDRLNSFAPPVFTKGYLKQYGNMLGLDERDLLAQYYRQVDVGEAPMLHHKPIRLRDDDQIRHWLAAGLVLAILCAGVATWWLAQPDTEAVSVERASEQPLAPARVAEPAPAINSRAELPPVATSSIVETGPQATDRTIEQAASTGPGSGPAGETIEINFIEDCWTEISDARGERLFYGLGSAGARTQFDATLPISIFFGNVGGVEISVNGDPYLIPADSRQGNLARFVIADVGF